MAQGWENASTEERIDNVVYITLGCIGFILAVLGILAERARHVQSPTGVDGKLQRVLRRGIVAGYALIILRFLRIISRTRPMYDVFYALMECTTFCILVMFMYIAYKLVKLVILARRLHVRRDTKPYLVASLGVTFVLIFIFTALRMSQDNDVFQSLVLLVYAITEAVWLIATWLLYRFIARLLTVGEKQMGHERNESANSAPAAESSTLEEDERDRDREESQQASANMSPRTRKSVRPVRAMSTLRRALVVFTIAGCIVIPAQVASAIAYFATTPNYSRYTEDGKWSSDASIFGGAQLVALFLIQWFSWGPISSLWQSNADHQRNASASNLRYGEKSKTNAGPPSPTSAQMTKKQSQSKGSGVKRQSSSVSPPAGPANPPSGVEDGQLV